MQEVLTRVAPGTKQRLRLAGGLPALAVRGAQDGPALGVAGLIHGDEYEGPLALFRFFDDVDPASMRGGVLALPAANPAAFAAISRTHPEDEKNLARLFPGDAYGSASEVLAARIESAVIAGADFFLDLHTGGVRYAMPSMAGYYTEDPRSRAAAEAFGAPVIWGHPVIPPGRTLSSCLARGIPFLYTEGAGGGRIDAGDLGVFERGIWNLCAHLDMLPRRYEVKPPVAHLLGDGNVDASAAAPADGFFVPSVKLLDTVESGAPIGRLLDIDGSLIAGIDAHADGVIGLLRMCPSVRAGEPLYLLAAALLSGGNESAHFVRCPVAHPAQLPKRITS